MAPRKANPANTAYNKIRSRGPMAGTYGAGGAAGRFLTTTTGADTGRGSFTTDLT